MPTSRNLELHERNTGLHSRIETIKIRGYNDVFSVKTRVRLICVLAAADEFPIFYLVLRVATSRYACISKGSLIQSSGMYIGTSGAIKIQGERSAHSHAFPSRATRYYGVIARWENGQSHKSIQIRMEDASAFGDIMLCMFVSSVCCSMYVRVQCGVCVFPI